MRRRATGWALLFVLGCLFLSAGCETMKGAAKDIENTNVNLQEADAWMREHLW